MKADSFMDDSDKLETPAFEAEMTEGYYQPETSADYGSVETSE